MPRRSRPRDRAPDPAEVDDFAACLRDTPHLHTLVGLMEQRDVRIVPVDGRTDHGVPWAALVVQGREQVELLQRVAERIAAALEVRRAQDRGGAARG